MAGPTTPAKPSWSQPRATGRAGAATNTAAAAPGLAHDTPAAAAGAGTSSASGQPKGSAGLGSVFYASQWRQEMLLGKALAAVTLVTLLGECGFLGHHLEQDGHLCTHTLRPHPALHMYTHIAHNCQHLLHVPLCVLEQS